MTRIRRWTRVALGLVVMALPVAVFQLPPVQRGVLHLVDVIRRAGPWGVALYALAYVAGAVLLAPTVLLSGLAGYAYGFGWGLLVAPPSLVLGHSTAFVVGRRARGWLARRAASNTRFAAVTRAVGHDGFRIALLLRLTPVMPQNFLSYLMAVTPLRLRHFSLATFVGLLPITVLHVYVGSLVRDASELLHGGGSAPGPWRWITVAGGLVLSLALVLVTTRVASRALKKALRPDGEAPPVAGFAGSSAPPGELSGTQG